MNDAEIFVDDLMPCLPKGAWRWKEACHMFVAPSTDLEFLHIFAEQIGLKRKWFQNHTNIPHYDLTRSKRTLAVQYGAVQVDQRETVAFIKLWRQHRNDLGPQQVNRIK